MCFASDLVTRARWLNQNQPLLLTRFDMHIYTPRRRLMCTKQVVVFSCIFFCSLKGSSATLGLPTRVDMGYNFSQVFVRYISPYFIFANKARHLFVRSLWNRFVFSLQSFETHNRNNIVVDVSCCATELSKITLFFDSCSYDVNISFSASTWKCVWRRSGSGNWKTKWELVGRLQCGSGPRITPIAGQVNTARNTVRLAQCIMPKQATWSLLKIDYLTYVVKEEYAGVMFRWVRTCLHLRLEAMSTQFSLRFS